MRSATSIGIVLDEVHAVPVATLRAQLAAAAAVPGGAVAPHVTLAVTSGIAPGRVDAVLSAVAADFQPFTVRIRGAGIVHHEGDWPVVYLQVVRSPALDALHRALIDGLGPTFVDGHYRPDRWIPHVTVWSGPIVASSLEIVTDRIAGVSWNMPVADVSRLGTVGVDVTFGLGTGEVVELFHPELDAVGRPLGWELEGGRSTR
jgi:2'-5' RNA ligase